jgi:hypothetical protein
VGDQVLAMIRVVMSWHESQSDDFTSPIVRRMARTSSTARARQRVLNDDELRAIWKAADELKTPFARLMQFILLSGRRRLADPGCAHQGQAGFSRTSERRGPRRRWPTRP